MSSDCATQELKKPEFMRQYFDATGREYSTVHNIRCPNTAAHKQGDKNPSAKIYENANGVIVKCHGCGGSWDIFQLWQLDNGGTFKEAKGALRLRFGLDIAATGDKGKPRAKPTDTATSNEQPKPSEDTTRYLSQCFTACFERDNAGLAYLRKRGISDKTARKFEIGFDPQQGKRGAVVIPYGAGYLLRFIEPLASKTGKPIKALYEPKGATRGIFNESGALLTGGFNATPIFIVEGEIDAMSIEECGAVAISCGGTGGIGKVVKLAKQIGCGVFIPCADRDEAGDKAQTRLEKELSEIIGVHVFKGARELLIPDNADGTHLKDVNDALTADKQSFAARVADVVKKAIAQADKEEKANRPYITLLDIEEPPPEEENPRAIFRNGYLRKSGGLIFASVAGAGKSTFINQSAVHWVLGLPSFGITPVRPLRIAIIQAEDDAEELAMFRANIRKGLEGEGLGDRVDEALYKLRFYDKSFIGLTGEKFSAKLAEIQKDEHYDLVIVNPLNSYFDGDISLNADATRFFRGLIDPVIKASETECAIVFVHHAGKPPKGKDGTAWGKGAFAQYILQGAAELNNWARAVLVLTPFDNAPEYWTLTAAKRYKHIGWTDGDGKPARERVIAYSKDIVYWREPTAEEVATARTATSSTKPAETAEERAARENLELRQCVSVIVSKLTNTENGMTKSALWRWCVDEAPKQYVLFKNFNSATKDKPCNKAYENITANPQSYGVPSWRQKTDKGRTATFYGGGVAPLLPTNNAPSVSDAEADAETDGYTRK